MRIKILLLTLFLLPVSLFGQENVTVKGRVINEQGEAVEYVQVGIPKLQIGTISSADVFKEEPMVVNIDRKNYCKE